MTCVTVMMMYGGRILQVLFESISEGPGGFPYVFIITGEVTTLEPVYSPLLLTMGSLSLGETSRFLMVHTPFEVGLYTIPPTDLFNVRPWVYGMTM